MNHTQVAKELIENVCTLPKKYRNEELLIQDISAALKEIEDRVKNLDMQSRDAFWHSDDSIDYEIPIEVALGIFEFVGTTKAPEEAMWKIIDKYANLR